MVNMIEGLSVISVHISFFVFFGFLIYWEISNNGSCSLAFYKTRLSICYLPFNTALICIR